jgi:hypothetical protein
MAGPPSQRRLHAGRDLPEFNKGLLRQLTELLLRLLTNGDERAECCLLASRVSELFGKSSEPAAHQSLLLLVSVEQPTTDGAGRGAYGCTVQWLAGSQLTE